MEWLSAKLSKVSSELAGLYELAKKTLHHLNRCSSCYTDAEHDAIIFIFEENDENLQTNVEIYGKRRNGKFVIAVEVTDVTKDGIASKELFPVQEEWWIDEEQIPQKLEEVNRILDSVYIRRMQMNRIGLVGCAGLGKSSIASMLSKKLNLPFLESKDITRPILRLHDYQYGSGFVEKFLARSEIEEEIVSRRIEEEDLLSGGFVTDRTTLECFCYAFLALETYTEEGFSLLESACRKNLEKFSHLFYFPMSAGWFEENGVRTMNLHFQRLVDLTIRGISEEWKLPLIPVPEAAFEKKKVLDFILEKVKEPIKGKGKLQEFPL